MSKYAIGVDYGTLSVRALLVNIETGEEAATSVYEYPHGVYGRTSSTRRTTSFRLGFTGTARLCRRLNSYDSLMSSLRKKCFRKK